MQKNKLRIFYSQKISYESNSSHVHEKEIFSKPLQSSSDRKLYLETLREQETNAFDDVQNVSGVTFDASPPPRSIIDDRIHSDEKPKIGIKMKTIILIFEALVVLFTILAFLIRKSTSALLSSSISCIELRTQSKSGNQPLLAIEQDDEDDEAERVEEAAAEGPGDLGGGDVARPERRREVGGVEHRQSLLRSGGLLRNERELRVAIRGEVLAERRVDVLGSQRVGPLRAMQNADGVPPEERGRLQPFGCDPEPR